MHELRSSEHGGMIYALGLLRGWNHLHGALSEAPHPWPCGVLFNVQQLGHTKCRLDEGCYRNVVRWGNGLGLDRTFLSRSDCCVSMESDQRIAPKAKKKKNIQILCAQ